MVWTENESFSKGKVWSLFLLCFLETFVSWAARDIVSLTPVCKAVDCFTSSAIDDRASKEI